MEDIAGAVRSFILNEFLPGEDPKNLTDSTELVTSGIMDSLATLKIVNFIEGTFDISIEPHEADVTNLNTVGDIASLVQGKLSK